FSFGVLRPDLRPDLLTKPETRTTIADFALHVQCYWRLVGPDGIVVGYHDIRFPAGDDPKAAIEFDWQKGNRRDERLARFCEHEPKGARTVQRVEADRLGGLRIALGDAHMLEILPCNSVGEGKWENWRFFRTTDELTQHFVV